MPTGYDTTFIDNPWAHTVATNRTDYQTYTFDTTAWRVNRYITETDLDNFAHKIYKIVTEHANIDISEEEFMKILND